MVRNNVEAAYRRTDLFERRRRLMNDWKAYLADRPAGTEARCDHRWHPPSSTGLETVCGRVRVVEAGSGPGRLRGSARSRVSPQG